MSGTPTYDFYLTDLSFAVGLGVAGHIPTGEDLSGVLTYDATAQLYVSLQAMKSTFQFVMSDVSMNDLSGCDYYVFRNNAVQYPNDVDGDPTGDAQGVAFPSVAQLNIANAVVNKVDAVAIIAHSGGIYTYDEQQIQDDFIRHLAEGVFGSHFGTAIFDNVTDLCNNIVNLCSDTVSGDVRSGITYDTSGVYTRIQDALKWCDSANSYSNPELTEDPDTGLWYFTEVGDTDATNLTREIMQQIFNSPAIRNRLAVSVDGNGNVDPSGNGLLVDSPLPQPVPFRENDTLCMAVTFTPEASQVNVSTGVAVGPRRYLIKFVLKDDTTNWTPLYENRTVQQ